MAGSDPLLTQVRVSGEAVQGGAGLGADRHPAVFSAHPAFLATHPGIYTDALKCNNKMVI